MEVKTIENSSSGLCLRPTKGARFWVSDSHNRATSKYKAMGQGKNVGFFSLQYTRESICRLEDEPEIDNKHLVSYLCFEKFTTHYCHLQYHLANVNLSNKAKTTLKTENSYR